MTKKEARDRWWRELSRRGDPLHLTSLYQAFNAGFDAALEHSANVALAIDSGRGNEKEIARAIRACGDTAR